MASTESSHPTPPILSTTTPLPPSTTATNQEPLSPVSRSSTFEHKTSGAVPAVNPRIELDTPAINPEPVELDGGELASPENASRLVSPGLGEEEDIEEEFLGEKGEVGVGKELREKRKSLLERRSKDPGVIVDVPREPTAEEVLAARSNEGTVTPALGRWVGE